MEITNINPLSFTYYVDKLSFEDPILYKRTKRTFEVFGIEKLMKYQQLQKWKIRFTILFILLNVLVKMNFKSIY